MNSLQPQSSLPEDLALKIVSTLQVTDLCALGSCSRFWKEICESDSIWESLSRERWPYCDSFKAGSSSSGHCTTEPDFHRIFKEWRGFYMKMHKEMARNASVVIKRVEQLSLCKSLEVGDYLKAVEELRIMQFGYTDVEMFFFKPKLSVLHNLVGLHYCIFFLDVQALYLIEALQSCKIYDRRVCVKWWKLGRWFYGFRMRDESHSQFVSLGDLATGKDAEVLRVLDRGAVHEVLRVQLSITG